MFVSAERCAVEAHLLGAAGTRNGLTGRGVKKFGCPNRSASALLAILFHVRHAVNANFPSSSRREIAVRSTSRGRCDAPVYGRLPR